LTGIDGLAGEMVIAVKTGADPPDPPPLPVMFTVSAADPLTPADNAEMVAVPLAMPVAVPEAPTDATAEFEEFHCTTEVRFLVVPSE
jgi:hypothetical protein